VLHGTVGMLSVWLPDGLVHWTRSSSWRCRLWHQRGVCGADGPRSVTAALHL